MAEEFKLLYSKRPAGAHVGKTYLKMFAHILGTYRKMSDDEWNKVSEWDKSVVELYRKIIDLDCRGGNGGQNHGASSANGNDASEHDRTIVELWQKIKLGYEFYVIPESIFDEVSPGLLKAESSTNPDFW